jgi:2-haloalkanoic acid dehalogenase type II
MQSVVGRGRIDVVCFDLDETLCDTERSVQASRAAMLRYLLTRRVELDPAQLQDAVTNAVDAFIDTHDSTELSLRLTADEARFEYIGHALRLCDIDDARLTRELVCTYSAARIRTLHLFLDAVPVLQSLRGRYRLALLTNGPAEGQREKVEDLQLAPYFEHIIIAGEVGCAKPDPTIFQLLVTRCDVPPSRALYVGNSQEDDLVGAAQAGLSTAWINRTDERLNPGVPEPRYEFRTLSELARTLI